MAFESWRRSLWKKSENRNRIKKKGGKILGQLGNQVEIFREKKQRERGARSSFKKYEYEL